jgi:pimeloyl-ACP methyl ester carboxylesterase
MRGLRSAVGILALFVVGGAILAGCGGGGSSAPVARWKAWLCRPGQTVDWCNADQAVTLVSANGARRVVPDAPTPKRPIDCFYVYPTVSVEQRGNSDLKISRAEKQIVMVEASRFRQVCRVFAPVYRQTTAYSNTYGGDPKKAYADVLAAWRDYLAHDNHGRGVVLIGHSQGAIVLADLIRKEIEGSASARKRFVSAILLGGGITVAKGSDDGGSFEHVPACRTRDQTGCVVAYSTWGRTPPKNAAFQFVDGPSKQILCVNPAAPGGGKAPITPIFPKLAPEGIITKPLQPPVKTPWIGFPGMYTARCVQQGSRAWLLVEHVAKPGDRRERVQQVLRPSWGLHAADVNIALQQLVELVHAQGRAWAAGR